MLYYRSARVKCILYEYIVASVADPGCLSRIPDPGFSHPGSRIPDLGSRISDPGSQKTWGGKKIFYFICFLTFL
jgi:hypothetical protein